MKISFLSAFPPYRGGISKHSSLIYKYLIKNHEVQALNFNKLYPSIFFPGKTQYDEKLDSIGERVLSSTNLISWNNTASRIQEYNPDLFVFKFWHPFFVPCYNHIINKTRSKVNCKVIMICDNIFPHEKFPFSKILIKKLLSKVDGFIVQSSIVEEELKSLIENPVYVKKFHPIYDSYSNPMNCLDAREKLNISNSKVVLFFGFVRKYKGLDILIKSMEKVFEVDEDIKLLIAGECYGDQNKYYDIINKSRYKDNIIWIEDFIPESEISKYFSASNVVILPYRTASQSGIIPLAYHYNKPVITSDLESLKEVIDEEKTGHTFQLGSVEDLQTKILDFFNNCNYDLYEKNIIEYKRNFSWESFVSGIDEVCKALDERR